MKRNTPAQRETLYRESFEWNAGIGWLIASTFMAGEIYYTWHVLSPTGRHFLAGIIFFMLIAAGINLVKSIPILRTQIRMFITSKLERSSQELRLINGVGNKKGNELINTDDSHETYLADGFEWGAEHANRAYQILDMSTDKGDIVMPWVVMLYVRHLMKFTREMGGDPWIYNLGNSKKIMLRQDTTYGHTMITGNVGTGKTTLIKMLSNACIHLGHIILAIDPKNDEDWKEGMRKECETLGIPFYSFHPSKGSTSVAIDPCANFIRDGELASRISGIQSDPSKADPFRDFAWYSIYRTTIGCRYLGEKPTLLRLYRYMTSERSGFITKIFERYFEQTVGPDWKKTLKSQIDAASKIGDWTEGLVNLYETKFQTNNPVTAVSEMLGAFRHPYEHYQKMTTAILPLFANLTAAPLDELLSPEDNMLSDRTVLNLKSMFDTGGVLHIAIDSLSDPQTAQRMVQLIVADIAAIAGQRYNTDMTGSRRVSIFIDEGHAALCEQLLSLLAQGRASKMALTVATQTISDLVAKSSEAVANRLIGLCNNWISTRVSDPLTKMKVAENFGKVSVDMREISISQRSSTEESHHNFAGGYSERFARVREDSVSANLIGRLPKLQAFCTFADGRSCLIKIPFISR